MVLGQGKVGSPAVSLVEEASQDRKSYSNTEEKGRGSRIYAVIFSLFGIKAKIDLA